ncbi:diguanylate cyclase domain-containing protein [Pseudoalteromonas sp. SSDWG2]|uniref:diguanylate cyclase domain-containing protein n=1 Tax=Pseudoalteromonas sp. SSDWG2 TaxID=3139391 RepID=UPI003BAC1013
MFRAALLLILCLCGDVANASVHALTKDTGLASNRVSHMLVDEHGYLWLATESGLNKYDGYQVQSIHDEKKLLQGAVIEALYEDANSDIWISSLLNGLFHYQLSSGALTQVIAPNADGESSFDTDIFSLLSWSEQHILLGRGHDVALLNRDTRAVQSLFATSTTPHRAQVDALARYQGYVIAGTSEGVWVHEMATAKTRHLADILADSLQGLSSKVNALSVVDNTLLYVGTNQGLFEIDLTGLDLVFDNATAQSVHDRALVVKGQINDIYLKSDATMLLATGDGVFHFNQKTKQLTVPFALTHDNRARIAGGAKTVLETPAGNVWVAATEQGAMLITQPPLKLQDISTQTLKGEGFAHSTIWSTAQQQHTLYVGTHNGLSVIDLTTGQSKSYFQYYQDEKRSTVFRIFTLQWFAQQLVLSTSRGLFLFDPQSLQLTKLLAHDKSNQEFLEGVLHHIYVSPEGVLFGVNQHKGYFYIDLNSKKVHPLHSINASHEPASSVAFLPSPKGSSPWPLFFAGGSLYRITKGSEVLTPLYSLPKLDAQLAINLSGFAFDNSNRLWLSLSNYGLIALDTETFEVRERVDFKQARVSPLMFDLQADAGGFVWMSSHDGLWRFNPQTQHFVQFAARDGLNSDDFVHGSASRFADHRFAYATQGGVILVEPLRSQANFALSKVNFTSAQLMYRPLATPAYGPLKEIELAHDDVGLEVTFSAMVFHDQDRITYQYQLDGSQTSYTQNNNRVVFPKFNPGSHVLKVWAQDPYTGELSDPARLTINVAYPLWSSPKYLALYIIVVAILVGAWLLRRNRTQKMLMQAHLQSVESATRLKLALEGSHSGVWDWQSDAGSIYQPRLVEELGYDFEHCQLDEYLALIHPDERQRFRIEWLEFLSTDKGYFNCVYRLKHRSGLWRWYKDFGKVMQWQDGHPVKVAGTYTNMTRELVFEENARLFGAAFEQTSDWVIIFDHKLRITATNKSLRQHFNYSSSCRSSRRLTLGLSKNTRINYLRILKGLRVGEHYQCEEVVVIKNGEHVPVLMKFSAVADNEHQATSFIVMMTDISAPKNALLSVRERANYDSLTGFPNRALFMDRVDHALEQAQRNQTGCALILINVSNLANINDTKGFDSGDQLLLSLAYRLQRSVRGQDSLGRLQGDEFALLIEDIDDVEQVITVCRKVRDVLVQPFNQPPNEALVRVGLGVSLFPQDAVSAQELIKCADIATYHAKRGGVNQCHFFQPEINAAVQRSIETERDVAIACENYDFVNLYQSICATHDKHIEAFAVLLHWQQGEHLIAPGHFLPHLRQSALWAKLLLQTLERAMLECRVWHRQHPTLGLNVAISGREFSEAGVMGDIIHLLHSHEFPLPYLTLEISVRDWQRIENNSQVALQTLADEGVRICLFIEDEDQLSVGLLSDDMFHRVKLGPQLTKQLCEQPKLTPKLRKYMAVFSALGLEIMAVGVANATEQRKLISLGCTLMQGDDIHTPCHGDGVAQLLSENR